MKLSLSAFVALGALASGSLKAQIAPLRIKGDTVTVQMQKMLGVGPDGMTSASFVSKDRYINEEEYQTYPVMKNIPAELSMVKGFFFPLDRFQFFFQSYKAGKITFSGFQKKANEWGWNLSDTTRLSKSYLTCFVNAAVGKNENNCPAFVIDMNNNGDYADDSIMLLRSSTDSKKEILSSTVLVSSKYEHTGKVVEKKVPVVVFRSFNSPDEILSMMFPEFSAGRFTFENIPYLMTVSSGYIRQPFVAVLPDKPSVGQVSRSDQFNENQYLKINNSDFKVIKIDKDALQVTLTGKNVSGFMINSAQVLNKQLAARTPAKTLTSFSTGYMAPPIKGLNINLYSKKYSNVSLASLKGKFVFVNFWATYCGPCIAEMPYLVKAYEKYPRDKFEIIGVFNETDAKITQKLMRDNFVSWPNILQHAKTSNLSGYGFINSYPTTLLINPEGKIVAKGLRGDELMMKLDELLSANIND